MPMCWRTPQEWWGPRCVQWAQMRRTAFQGTWGGTEPPWSSIGRTELRCGLPYEEAEAEPTQAQAGLAQSLSDCPGRW
ncbi:hypothetical protein NDU88_003044 [Pleurodeles waltl]|uniref:Uncharacterized protein n=1 Tax=Pleurodeles waltl TaxID=8319 RepID=A0AAV7TME1_PLEWA|nr:hypothetical protein NDU88_003044 [Pleurodeles waltl]